MKAFEPRGGGLGIRVVRGAWATRWWGGIDGACVMGQPALDDHMDLGEFLQGEGDFKLAKEGLSSVLSVRIGDRGEQRWLRSDVRGEDGQEICWCASATGR